MNSRLRHLGERGRSEFSLPAFTSPRNTFKIEATSSVLHSVPPVSASRWSTTALCIGWQQRSHRPSCHALHQAEEDSAHARPKKNVFEYGWSAWRGNGIDARSLGKAHCLSRSKCNQGKEVLMIWKFFSGDPWMYEPFVLCTSEPETRITPGTWWWLKNLDYIIK